MEEDRVFPSRTEIGYSIGMVGVEFGQLLGNDFNGREVELKGNLGSWDLVVLSIYPTQLYHFIDNCNKTNSFE